MTDHRKALGEQGEGIAVDYLRNKGYHILARNYRLRYGEIDIICEHESTIIFIEVRSKKSLRFGHGVESVNWKKQQRIQRVAMTYLSQHNLHQRQVRFDVIDIYFNPDPQITHIKYAF